MTTFWLAILVAVCGGLGASTRYAIEVWFPIKSKPWLATFLINASGSFVLGLTIGLVASWLPAVTSIAIGTGFLGGFTTFSTTSLQLAEMVARRKYLPAVTIALAQLLLSVVLLFAGWNLAFAF